jgi:PadR family transcriptional regulator, regulatory protein PadR
MKSSRTPEAGLVSNFEEHVMLAVLRTGSEAAYGMAVRRELETVTGRDVTIGSVYITLDRLEAKGLVTSARTAATAESASRRVFSVTALGARSLAETRAVRDRLWQGIELRPLLRPAR